MTPHARRLRRGLTAAATTVALLTGALLAGSPALAAPPQAIDPAHPDFGPNVTVFDPSMPMADIQSTLDDLANAQRSDEMGTSRHAVYFLPGDYGTADHPLRFEVGYYTEVEGLGATPGGVTLTGAPLVFNQCYADGSCFALNNFWRTLGNMTIDVAGGDGCRYGMFWAVSQAASMRRLDVNGQLTLMDYCTAGPQWASGGFIADSRLNGVTINGSQQQWLTRNSVVANWTNGVWNQVFAGVQGAPSEAGFPAVHDARHHPPQP
jgi:hypothetical protein